MGAVLYIYYLVRVIRYLHQNLAFCTNNPSTNSQRSAYLESETRNIQLVKATFRKKVFWLLNHCSVNVHCEVSLQYT